MSTGKSITKSGRDKPAKPSAGFPLFPHRNGQWAKKVRGRLHYFGTWDDADAALQRWDEVKSDLIAGRTPRPRQSELTLAMLTERFLTAKRNRVESGELAVVTFRDYCDIVGHIERQFGRRRLVADLAAEDFVELRRSFSAIHGPHRLGKDVVVTRSLFRWGYESDLIAQPVRFGPEFTPPSRKAKLKAARESGRRDFEASELRRLIAAAEGPLKAMILLGINAGLGQKDLASLQRSHIADGWLNFPRPKTEVERRCPLWPDTLEAIGTLERPQAVHPRDADCVFLTERGTRVVRITDRSRTDTVGANFAALMKSLNLNGRRGFYGLRHSFATAAGDARDQAAIDLIMGHRDATMAANYRHRISDRRLEEVVAVVRAWLWPAVTPRRTEPR